MVGCLLTFDVDVPTTLAVQVAAARRAGLDVSERLEVLNNGTPLTAQEVAEPDGGRHQLIRTDPGTLTVTYHAELSRRGAAVAEPVTDQERLIALRPSRYCPADRLAGFAADLCGQSSTDLDRVRRICAYVWQHVVYDTTSGPTTDAVDTLLSGRGVCRDFAHLVAALCRAVGVPARIAAVYAPGLSPMDFHAVVETAIDGTWLSWDATRLAPRATLIRIGTGRDAADIAFATTLLGTAVLTGLQITATSAGDLPLDDHVETVGIG